MKKLVLICAFCAIAGTAWGAAHPELEKAPLTPQGFAPREQAIINVVGMLHGRPHRPVLTSGEIRGALEALRWAVTYDDALAAKWVAAALEAFERFGSVDGSWVEYPFKHEQYINVVKPKLISLGFPQEELKRLP